MMGRQRSAWERLSTVDVPILTVMMAVLAAPPLNAAPQSLLPRVLVSRTLFTQSAPIAADMLATHNVERRAAGVSDLVWDDKLARDAQVYAHELARLGHMRHSDAPMRPGQGENLWMGTRDYFDPATMVQAWASERKMFRAARFPDVSTTGNWLHVGHYTQMIWPGTRQVGCALSRGAQADFLVCRYFPAGNVMGSPVP